MTTEATRLKYQADISDQLDSAQTQKERWTILAELLQEYLDRFIAFVGFEPTNLREMMHGPFWLLIQLGSIQCQREKERLHLLDDDKLAVAVQHLKKIVDEYSNAQPEQLSADQISFELGRAIQAIEKAAA